MPSSKTLPWAVLSVFLFLLAPYGCARPLGVIRAIHSTSDHHLVTNHRKLETVSANSFQRRAPLPPSGHSERRNTELSPIDRVQLPGVIGAVRSTNRHHLIPDHRKLETVSPNSFQRRAPLPPSGHSERRNTELSPIDRVQLPGVIGAVRSTNHHHLIPDHRKLGTVSPNSFPRRAPLPPSGHSERRNTELSPTDRVQLPGVIGAVRSTSHHHLIPDHRKLGTVSPNSFPRRAPLPPSSHSKRRNTELNSSDRAQLPGIIGAVRSTDHHRIISESRNLEMGQMFNFLPRGVPLPPSAPSKRRNAELQSDPLP